MAKLKIINIILAVLGILVLIFDLFVTDEFQLEGIFVLGYTGLLIIYILSLDILDNRIHFKIKVLLNFVLTGFLIWNIIFLLILAWGIGFLGGSYPIIWSIGLALNIALLLCVYGNIHKLFKNN